MKDGDGTLILNKEGIANRYNSYFSSVGENMASKYKDISKSPLDYVLNGQPFDKKLVFSDTTKSEVSKLIRNLKNKKASGFDLISNCIVKCSSKIIGPVLVDLFNKCMQVGFFPDTFKTAKVIPIFKKGDHGEVSCYRPISLLPVLGKLYEKIIAVRTIRHFNDHNLFSKHQFGFREGFTTEYAMLDIFEKLLYNLDNGLSSCAVFLDLAKAFDSVSHSILLQKLSIYGIRDNSLKLFESYLDSRKQFVEINGVSSSMETIKFGVPQGSILGPLLFLIFINDLPEATKFYVKLFADDTFLCAQNIDFKHLETEVNDEIEKVHTWLASNKLTLNTSKSKFMIISNKKAIPRNFTVAINGENLEKCTSYKYLGIIFDEKLNWKEHVSYVCGKVASACGALAKLRHCVNTNILKEFYHALSYSYIRYGLIVWGNALPTTLKPVQALMNRAARIITFSPFGHIDMKPIYECLEILDLKNAFLLETSKFIFKQKKRSPSCAHWKSF